MRFNSGGDDSGACAYKQEEDEWYCVVHGSCFAWNAVAAEALEGAVVCVNKKAVLCCHRQRTSPRTKKDCSTMTAILYLRKCNLFVCFEAGERDRRRRFRSTRIIFYGWRPRYLSWWMRRFHLESSLWDVREFANLLINLHHRMQNWRIVGGWLWQSGLKKRQGASHFLANSPLFPHIHLDPRTNAVNFGGCDRRWKIRPKVIDFFAEFYQTFPELLLTQSIPFLHHTLGSSSVHTFVESGLILCWC